MHHSKLVASSGRSSRVSKRGLGGGGGLAVSLLFKPRYCGYSMLKRFDTYIPTTHMSAIRIEILQALLLFDFGPLRTKRGSGNIWDEMKYVELTAPPARAPRATDVTHQPKIGVGCICCGGECH